MKRILSFLFLFLLSCGFNLSAQESMSLQDIINRNKRPEIAPYRNPKTGLYGYKNTKTDKVIVPCKYKMALAFFENRGAVNIGGTTTYDSKYTNDYTCKGGLWGYVDSTGTMVVPAKYTLADEYHNGFSAVERNGFKALIDINGNVLTPFEYVYVYPMSEGLAVVGKGKPLKFGYIDTKGKLVIGLEYDEANSFFKGKARVSQYGGSFLINKKGVHINY
jgi:hypothetical protein